MKPDKPPRASLGIEKMTGTPQVARMTGSPGFVGGKPSSKRCPNCEHAPGRHVVDPVTNGVWCLACGVDSGYHALTVE